MTNKQMSTWSFDDYNTWPFTTASALLSHTHRCPHTHSHCLKLDFVLRAYCCIRSKTHANYLTWALPPIRYARQLFWCSTVQVLSDLPCRVRLFTAFGFPHNSSYIQLVLVLRSAPPYAPCMKAISNHWYGPLYAAARLRLLNSRLVAWSCYFVPRNYLSG